MVGDAIRFTQRRSGPDGSKRFCHAGLIDVEPFGKEDGVEIRRSVLVPYTVESMFDLIEQAESYPSFLPWCTSAEIIERSDEWVGARLEVSYLNVRFAMRTRNPKRRPEWLQVRLVEGPFKRFHGDWHLLPLADQGCKVSFELSYELSAGLFDRVASAALDRVFASVVEAFVKRAEATLVPLVAGGPAAPAVAVPRPCE